MAPSEDGGDRDPLVAQLVSQGVPVEEAVQIRLAGRAPLAIIERLIVGDTPYTRDDLVRLSGVDEHLLVRWHTAFGIADEEHFNEDDLIEAKHLVTLLEVLSFDTLLRMARLRRMAASQVALGDIGVIREELLAPLRGEGADDITVSEQLTAMTSLLWPAALQTSVNAHRRAIVRVLRMDAAAEVARSGAPQVHLAIGFVDLVGYTRLSAQVDPAGLSTLLAAFERRVFEVIDMFEHPNVAKFLGDAAMIVSTDTLQLVDALLTLVEPVDELEDAPLRGGVAAGPVVIREGDYFGDPVNAAARLTDVARPWSLLADREMRDLLREHFEVKSVPPLKLSGIGKRRPVVVRPREADE